MTTFQLVTAYLGAVERHDLDEVARLLHPDVQVIEHPNKITPAGRTYDKAALRVAGERGAALMQRERYEIRSVIVEGDRAAVSIAWTGTLQNGAEMRAEICSVIEVRDEMIYRQEQYDCFA